MQFKYCPQCGNLDFKQDVNGPVCIKCHYAGTLPEGSMDKINEIRKRSRAAGAAPMPSKPTINTDTSVQELALRLKNLKGKSTEDVEFL